MISKHDVPAKISGGGLFAMKSQFKHLFLIFTLPSSHQNSTTTNSPQIFVKIQKHIYEYHESVFVPFLFYLLGKFSKINKYIPFLYFGYIFYRF